VSALLDLFTRFAAISLLAFGGGGAALALIERIAVHQNAWITLDQFAAAVSFGYVTPGPILILASFIGYYVAGLPGVAAATVGVFVMPWMLAAAAARQLHPYMRNPRLRGFGRAAAPAVTSLFAVTVLSLARSGVTSFGYLVIALIAGVLTAKTRLNPIAILAAGAVASLVVGLPSVQDLLRAIRPP
jgi:chromate transporter